MKRRPNIVFVLTDDQGYGELGCHGNPVIQTPHMDALHAVSFRLTNYHVGPTCAPTRAGLMTGHYHNSTGVWHTIGGRSLLRQDEWSLATAFSEAGYVTGLFGKWHLGDNHPYRPLDRGFQEVVTHGGGGVGNTPDYWGNKYNDDHYRTNGEWVGYEGYCTDVWFDQALCFIDRQRHTDDPFVCFVTTNAPHSPFIVDERYSDPYVGRVEHQDRANFYGMITCIDENLGQMRARLREWGLEENTIFIFMTDNGTAGGATLDEDQFVVAGYNAGMRGIKGSEYEGGHRVPLFIHWPAGGIDHGRDIPELTANVDVLPTLLDLCGIDPGEHTFHGVSLAPLLMDTMRDQPGHGDAPPTTGDQNAFHSRGSGVPISRGSGIPISCGSGIPMPRSDVSQAADVPTGDTWPNRIVVTDSQRVTSPIKWRKSATMTQRWRLVNGVELYDMEVDPGQRQDVADRHPEIVAELRAGYERWWALVSEQFDGTIPIPIGENAGETVLLNSHDWRNDPVECAWNQSLVRAGMECNGYWEIDVVASGRYRFELRRWPRLEDRPIVEGIPGEVVAYYDLRDSYGGGRALPLVSARLRVAEQDQTRPIAPEDKYAAFTVDLQAGETLAQSYLYDAEGRDIGAYYVYVERLDDEGGSD